ncbi:MAG: hypothetical protein ACI8VJ_000507 [Polaribacter sp.]|jgi:hypothetical protein
MIVIINYDFIAYYFIKKIILFFYAFFTKQKDVNYTNYFLNYELQLPLQICLKIEY